MAIRLKPPQKWQKKAQEPWVFLAGTIEMGDSANWQHAFGNKLLDLDINVLDPRRDDWDSSWEQSIHHAQFNEQVTWELDGIEGADLVFFHFEPNSKSPITLLELGICAPRQPCLVHCPPTFWRKGNVDIVCARYQVPQVNSLTEGLTFIKNKLKT